MYARGSACLRKRSSLLVRFISRSSYSGGAGSRRSITRKHIKPNRFISALLPFPLIAEFSALIARSGRLQERSMADFIAASATKDWKMKRWHNSRIQSGKRDYFPQTGMFAGRLRRPRCKAKLAKSADTRRLSYQLETFGDDSHILILLMENPIRGDGNAAKTTPTLNFQSNARIIIMLISRGCLSGF